MLKKTRLAAVAAVLLIAVAGAVGAARRRRRKRSRPRPPPPPRPPHPPPRRAAAPAAKAAAKATEIDRQPVRSRSAVEGRRPGRQDHAGDPRHHVDGQLVHHHHQGVRAVQDGRAGASDADKTFWKAPSVREGAEGLKKTSPYRFIAESGLEATTQARRPARQRRPERLDHDVDPARDRQRAEPHAGRPRVPRHRRLDRAVRRPVRHGVGHLPRADGHRHRRPGVDRQGRRARGRGADHDGHRPRGRGSGGARLQLAHPPQQGGDGPGAQLRRRPARGAAVDVEVAGEGLTPWR